jgi:glucose 1-dehydrogenase
LAGGPELPDIVVAHVPLRRVGDPAEQAAAIAFLASEDASYITGQTPFVDGGYTAA